MKRLVLAVLVIAVFTTAMVTAQMQQNPPPPGPGPAGPPPGGMAPQGPMMGPGARNMQGPAGPAVGPSPLMVLRVPPAQFLERMQTELNLSEDQQTKAKSAMDKYSQKAKPLAEQYTSASKDLQATAWAAKFDAAKVKAASAKTIKAEDALLNASIDFWTEFRGLLTTEQNEKLCQLMPMGGRPAFGPRPGGQGGPGPMGGPGMGGQPGAVPPPPGNVPPPPAPGQ